MPERSSVIMRLLLILLILQFSGGGSSAPFPADKLSVLVVESSEAQGKLPAAQGSALDSTLWRAYVEKQGGQWRVLDDQADITKELEWVKAAMAVKRDSLPWLAVSDGKSGSTGALPQDLESIMLELKKTGGE